MPHLCEEELHVFRKKHEEAVGSFTGKNRRVGRDGMKELLRKANTQLEQATRGGADRCDIMYAAGYRQAIIDVYRKLNDEGLEELEDE